jgi:hypothetical protein
MKPFSISSVAGSVTSLERAFAPTSLPTIIPQRGIVTTQAEYQLSHEWNEEAPKIGFVVGAAAVGVGYVVVKLLRKK